MAGVERAHASLNAACNALATARGELPSPHDIGLARGYVADACRELQASRGRGGDAAAVAAMPRPSHRTRRCRGSTAHCGCSGRQ